MSPKGVRADPGTMSTANRPVKHSKLHSPSAMQWRGGWGVRTMRRFLIRLPINPSPSWRGIFSGRISCGFPLLPGMYACLYARPPLNLPRTRGRLDRHHRTDSPLPPCAGEGPGMGVSLPADFPETLCGGDEGLCASLQYHSCCALTAVPRRRSRRAAGDCGRGR